MYNHNMKKLPSRKHSSRLFLILGIAFLTIGMASDRTAFTWISIAFILNIPDRRRQMAKATEVV